MIREYPVVWVNDNQRYLTVSLSLIYTLVECGANRVSIPDEDSRKAELNDLVRRMEIPPAVEKLCAVFGLSPFERAILLLCAGVELDSRFAKLLSPQIGPTFGMALGVLPEAHWSALSPVAPLRYWRLVEIGNGGTLTQSPLRIDERILNYLAGASHLDDRLTGYVEQLPPAKDCVPSHRIAAQKIAACWSGETNLEIPPVIQLYGEDRDSRRQVAMEASTQFRRSLCSMRIDSLPSSPAEIGILMRLWERESLLENKILLLECDDAETHNPIHWIERAFFPLILSTRERMPVGGRRMINLEIRKPTIPEQYTLWCDALGNSAQRLDGGMEQVIANFDLGTQSIREIAAGISLSELDSDKELRERVWQACRVHAHPRLGELAQQIRPAADWCDLVLPERQIQSLREMAVHVRRRMKVYETWGFAQKCTRGMGISALFAGPSGTGKTMAAEVLANELQLDLYRIDLSQVVSKYIGETEKNLKRLFDAAETGGAILLFDEADAVFGKRSEVRDSHDRYANVEVSYLLQRMETYRGLAILTTNMKEAIDTAFLRRIRFIVKFPFPDAAQRAEIWRRIFPAQTPTDGIEVDKLARLNITGGSIHNIALYAAFLAADADEPVRMAHLLRAARVEFSKMERPVNESELGRWI